MYEQTFGLTNIHADRQTDGRTNERTDGQTDSHIRPHARAHAHTWMLACLHAHTMHSGTYARTDRHTHTCSYGGKHPSTNMEFRIKKVKMRMHWWTHACANKHLDARTCPQTDRHTDRQIDGRTDGLNHTPSRTRAIKHTNACIDERTHVRSNIWTHEHARGRRQIDRQTDGRTHTYAFTHARMHTHER